MVQSRAAQSEASQQLDAVVVGAGFAGIYMLHKLRSLGFKAHVFEAGENVGGTWYWNRYPGARCDAESLIYSYSFSKDIEREWSWTEKYATQPEILRYLNFVADRLDLRRDMTCSTRVTSAVFDEKSDTWTVETDKGHRVSAKFCIMATGCLSMGRVPAIAGLKDFKGKWHHTGAWPHEGVDFTGKRVAVIGTGSSGIQAIPVIAKQAGHLTVFQRTPNFSVPAVNAPLAAADIDKFNKNSDTLRQMARTGELLGAGDVGLTPEERNPLAKSSLDVSADERLKEYERRWRVGGAQILHSFADIMVDEKSNVTIADFVRDKIRATVKDPKVAALLAPTDHPLGSKRICVDTDYYATYNRPNVNLVDLNATPIERITADGLRTSEKEYQFDIIVFATGFDAMTGALLGVDIRGLKGQPLREKWHAGPRSYLGVGVVGFPNLLTVTGPGSPSVLSNVIVSIEQHVDWMSDLLVYMRKNGLARIEPNIDAENTWVDHVNQVANGTLFAKGKSWYLGANIPGKPRVFMPYAGGVGPYRQTCDRIAANNYEGFTFTSAAPQKAQKAS